jgi:hypothetical protein
MVYGLSLVENEEEFSYIGAFFRIKGDQVRKLKQSGSQS